MKVQSVQPTPNPNALKFIVDNTVIESGFLDYANEQEVSDDPLAQALFSIAGIASLFFCENFVTITMTDSADWRAVNDAVIKCLDDFDGASPRNIANNTASEAATPPGDPQLLERINGILDERIRPALAGDGGGLEILGLDGKTLTIRYQGACGSCPSSIQGTLMAIQGLLQSEVDAELSVIPA
ncbi:MAG: NifU family protein [Planctomycetota bacterium]|jgi:Fe-S cluster biogenesis protein NfuA|nr:NifU family protein [Planctomycetota bacterium]